jgi:hypothetical protein
MNEKRGGGRPIRNVGILASGSESLCLEKNIGKMGFGMRGNEFIWKGAFLLNN